MSHVTSPCPDSADLKTFLPPMLELNEHDAGKRGLDGSNVNQPASQQLTDFGRGAVFYECLVELQAAVRRVRGPHAGPP